MEINGNLWKSMGIYGNLWEFMEIYGNLWKFMEKQRGFKYLKIFRNLVVVQRHTPRRENGNILEK